MDFCFFIKIKKNQIVYRYPSRTITAFPLFLELSSNPGKRQDKTRRLAGEVSCPATGYSLKDMYPSFARIRDVQESLFSVVFGARARSVRGSPGVFMYSTLKVSKKGKIERESWVLGKKKPSEKCQYARARFREKALYSKPQCPVLPIANPVFTLPSSFYQPTPPMRMPTNNPYTMV